MLYTSLLFLAKIIYIILHNNLILTFILTYINILKFSEIYAIIFAKMEKVIKVDF